MSDYTTKTPELKTACGSMFVTILWKDDLEPDKILVHMGKAGTCARALLTSYSEILSAFVKNTKDRKALMQGLLNASGHTCQHNHNTCIDKLNRYILNEVLSKIEEGEEKQDEH